MKNLFRDILQLDDIKGIILLSEDGAVLFKELLAPTAGDLENSDWISGLSNVDRADEIEFVYENDRIYVRKMAGACLLIWMGGFAPAAMVRVNCDILIPSLEKSLSARGLRRFFKKF